MEKGDQYVQTVHECLRNEEREAETRRRAKGQTWEPTRVFRTHIQLGSPQPYSTALLPKRDPPNGPTKKIQKQTNKKANRGSFLFDFKIPRMKEEGASWSWCPTKAYSFPKEASSHNSSQPHPYYRHLGLEQPWGFLLQTQIH